MRFCALALLLAFFSISAVRAETAEPQTILIGLDLSQSNPLVLDSGYAARAGARVAQALVDLPLKSRVILRTFGSYDSSSNGLKIDQTINVHAKPQSVARGIASLIADVPALVKAGKLKSQPKTNILPFLETMFKVIDCRTSHVRVILLTDGFEDSEYAKLTRHGGKLPMPSTAIYKDCNELQMLGLGQGAGSPSATARLIKAWERWAAAAGFASFTGLYDW